MSRKKLPPLLWEEIGLIFKHWNAESDWTCSLELLKTVWKKKWKKTMPFRQVTNHGSYMPLVQSPARAHPLVFQVIASQILPRHFGALSRLQGFRKELEGEEGTKTEDMGRDIWNIGLSLIHI